MEIAVLVADGVVGSGMAALTDVLLTAEALRDDVLGPATPPVTVRVLGSARVVTCANGFMVATDGGLDDAAGADVVVVPGFGVVDEAGARHLLRARRVVALGNAVAEVPGSVAAACAGTFVLAGAGRLTGRRATTTWWLERLFRTRHPDIELDVGQMLVRDGDTVTAGAAFAHVDLALELVGRVSADLAAAVASVLVVDTRASQAAYRSIAQLASADPLVAAFDRHVTAHLAGLNPIDVIAAELGTTRRTLERRVREVTGTSPLGLIRERRRERATQLRERTSMSTDRIAVEVGYRNASTLRALLRENGAKRTTVRDSLRAAGAGGAQGPRSSSSHGAAD